MFRLTVATPEKTMYHHVDVTEVTLPGAAGELNILPGHAPMVTTLEAGVASFKFSDGTEKSVALAWGYCQVSPSEINVLAEEAASFEDIDKDALVSERKKLEEAMAKGDFEEHGFQKYFSRLQEIEAQERLISGQTLH
jgi:F-type H+-transporting ATPase subunit epsilon